MYDLILARSSEAMLFIVIGGRALDRSFVSVNPGGGCNFWFDMIPLLFLIDPVY